MNDEPNEIIKTKLTRDLKKLAQTLTLKEVRCMVDFFTIAQKDRIRADNQVRAMQAEPHAVLDWAAGTARDYENQMKSVLNCFAQAHPLGQWLLQIYGIGPIFTAGLLAHIDITKCPTVGHIWAFAGLDPTRRWLKGEKRPHNAALKRLCFLIGKSFVKTSGRPASLYGRLYLERKAYEAPKIEAGDYSAQAQAILEARPTHKQKTIYAAGKLPPGHLDMRAMRYTVKLFLSHLHEAWYRWHYKQPPPKPFALAHLEHGHYIPPEVPFPF